MDVREIGNALLRKQTLYEQSVKQSEEAAVKIRGILGSITDEQREICMQMGVDISPLLSVNLERVKQNKDYRDSVCSMQNDICGKLAQMLEEAADLCSE